MHINKAASIISNMIAILESRMPLDERPNMVKELILGDSALNIIEVLATRTRLSIISRYKGV
jgi:hypothetical protein